MKIKSLLLLIFFVGTVGTTLAQTRPARLYVDASYSGTVFDGTEQFPFKSIRQALDFRQNLGISGMSGDEEIVVKAGDYYPTPSDMIIINRYNSGYNGHWLTLKSETPLGAKLNGDSLFAQKYAAIVGITDSAQWVRLEGFVVQHIRSNPALATWKASASDMDYSASTPTVPIEISEGVVARNLFGETIYDGRKDVKYGIQIAMDSRNIQVLNNEVRDISWTSAVDPYVADDALSESDKNVLRGAWPSDNAGPISVLGSDQDAMESILIKGNHVHHCIPGWTEAVTVNGYLIGFEISDNEVHHIRNIGIVAAGNYTWVVNDPNFSTPAAENYARNGLISGNKVYECQSPIAVSAGIYLDGSRNVVVEKNEVYRNHVGFSIGNETYNSHSGGHIIRNNISHHNHWAGMVLGSNGINAWVENVKVLGNTFADNNLNQVSVLGEVKSSGVLEQQNGVVVLKSFTGTGELILQKLSNSNTAPGAKIEIKNNIFKSRSGVLVNALYPFRTDAYISSDLVKSNLGNLLAIDYNFYYPQPSENINYNFYGAGFTGNTFNFANYQSETGLDPNSGTHELWSTENLPIFFKAEGGGSDFYRLADGALAINAGDPAAGMEVGDTDFANNTRIADSRIDIGAFESGAPAAGDVAAAIDGLKSAAEQYQVLQTGVTQGVWKNIHAYDDNHFIYVYGEYEGTMPEYSIFINKNSTTGYQHVWSEKSDYYVDGKLNLLNTYDINSSNTQWPFEADTTVMTIKFVKTGTTIEGRIPKAALGIGNSGTVGIGLEGHSKNWSTSVGTIPVSPSSMVYLTLDGGSNAGSLSIDGVNSPVEDYSPLITGVTGSSFNNLYGYADDEYVYLYAEISAANLWEYEVYVNTNSATGFQYIWNDKSDYFIDANYNVLHAYNNTEDPEWPFAQVPSSAGIEFVRTSTAVEGKILKSLIGVGNSGTIGIGLEGHTANWSSSLGGVPVSGSMVYLSLAGSTNARQVEASSAEIKVVEEEGPLRVYPNPVSDKLNITHYLETQGVLHVEVIGMDGKRHYQSNELLPSGNHHQVIPVANLPKGIFLVRITSEGKSTHKKVIIR
jgi:parallel beta-helix repeat protein